MGYQVKDKSTEQWKLLGVVTIISYVTDQLGIARRCFLSRKVS